jgi:predicted DNA-binding transcriptional regulator AlpA
VKQSNSSPEKHYRVGEVVINESLLAPLLEESCRMIGASVRSELDSFRQLLETRVAPLAAEQSQSPSTAARTGIEVTPADKIKAADLRTTLLLGKLPEDAGLLIDTKTTAKLLNISARTLYRLDQEQAMPAPIRLGGIIRWRVAEIIEWVDSDCTPRHRWTYSGYSGSTKKKSR